MKTPWEKREINKKKKIKGVATKICQCDVAKKKNSVA